MFAILLVEPHERGDGQARAWPSHAVEDPPGEDW